MFDSLLSMIAPHLCYGCEKIGTLLCESCEYDIVEEASQACLACGRLAGLRGVCGTCRVAYSRAWHVGERKDELRKLIDDYKFENTYAAHHSLAALLSRRIGKLPTSGVIVPVPTISSHVRQRGYDHTLLLAKGLAKLQSLPMQPLVQRQTATAQRGGSRSQRLHRAREAFVVRKRIESGPYILIDDIVTTGATIHHAAKALRDAGASDVWAAVLARQPLD